MKPPEFKTRHRITGTWTTLTPLHIGDGEVADLSNRSSRVKTPNSTMPATVCVDHHGKACIPGSGIKGPLRSLAKKILVPDMVNALFGHENADEKNAKAGAVIFSTAYHLTGCTAPKYTPISDTDRSRPYWDPARHTAVDIHVAIDRATRTADDQKLYATEYVPAGETFRWEITTEGLNDAQLAALLFLLSQASTLHFGAGNSCGWGKMEWVQRSIEVFDNPQLAEWIKNPTAPLPWAAYAPIAHTAPVPAPQSIAIHISIYMKSPWLVRDPRQRERIEHSTKEQRLTMSHALPRHGHDGRAYLSASSLKGVLRSHAERILRTVGSPCPLDPNEENAEAPSLAAQLFGHSGAKALLQVPDLLASELAEQKREHVAIDRFTGGAAEGAKFTETSASATTLTGTLLLDTWRLRNPAALGLLAHLLRDLTEGEIPLGSGSAKGRGFCTAAITIAGQEPWHQHPAIQDGLTAFHQSLTPTTP